MRSCPRRRPLPGVCRVVSCRSLLASAPKVGTNPETSLLLPVEAHAGANSSQDLQAFLDTFCPPRGEEHRHGEERAAAVAAPAMHKGPPGFQAADRRVEGFRRGRRIVEDRNRAI